MLRNYGNYESVIYIHSVYCLFCLVSHIFNSIITKYYNILHTLPNDTKPLRILSSSFLPTQLTSTSYLLLLGSFHKKSQVPSPSSPIQSPIFSSALLNQLMSGKIISIW